MGSGQGGPWSNVAPCRVGGSAPRVGRGAPGIAGTISIHAAKGKGMHRLERQGA